MRFRKIYLATSWRNERQPGMVKLLREAGHQVYDFRNPTSGAARYGSRGSGTAFQWSDVDVNWQSWTKEAFREIIRSNALATSGFASDFNAMHWADTIVMLQPCGRSAALELGWGAGAGKFTVVVLADGQEPELMLKMASAVVLTDEELLSTLQTLW